MVNGIRTGDPCGFDKGCSSMFSVGSWVQQTPEEGCWGNNNKDEDDSPKILNDKNHQALSQKFRQLMCWYLISIRGFVFFIDLCVNLLDMFSKHKFKSEIFVSVWWSWISTVKCAGPLIDHLVVKVWIFALTYKSTPRRCPWCNGYHCRKWTRQHEFKSWTRLIAFHIALIPLGKVWIQLFSLQVWVNSRADKVLQPWWGN